ncbi:verprolin-like [Ananas comosus]|uniref:Verprolin-like n=1 Tax=Ananas comosus TaxID=4615 RepID=A0A6P5F923_ANACO|nr:verprolin-like [Ananas comosus]
MATSKQKEGATTLREKTSSSSTVSSTRRSPSSRSSLPTSPKRRPEKPTVPSRGLTAVTASTAVVKPPSTRRSTERNAPATTALKERAVLKAPPSSSKAAASHKHLPEKPSASASSKSRTSHTSSVVVRGRSPGAVVKRKEAKNGSLSRTSSDPGLLEFAALSLLGNNKIEESTETTVSISSMEDHLPNELLPNPIDAKAAEDAPPPPPPPPHECNKQQHEQSPLESEGVVHEDGSRSNEEMIKEDNIEIAHNTTLEDPKGGGGDEVGNYEKEKLMLEVKKNIEKNIETKHGGKKEAVKSNDVIEETKSKLLERKKSKVKALVGAFETVMSLHGSEVQTDQTQEKGGGEMD